jgi:hypothetical protein
MSGSKKNYRNAVPASGEKASDMERPPIKRLKLVARDAADLEILSACLQDSVMKVADMAHMTDARRFVLMLHRYCWENTEQAMRTRTAVQIVGVENVQVKNIHQQRGEAVLSVLALEFTPGDAPAGTMNIIFAGGGEIRLAVEACEAILEDISDAWQARSTPRHEID